MSHPPKSGMVDWLTTADHKKIGIMYLLFALFNSLFGGAFAGFIRMQLFTADGHVLSPTLYNQFLTMHGSVMIFLVVIPALIGFGNYLVPLQIGARDMAFPKINAFSFWINLPAMVLMYGSFIAVGGAAQAGWTSYPPLSGREFSPSPGVDMWIFGVHLLGIGSILGAINFIVTILNMRAPGMTMFKMPLFTWTWLVNASMILVATPVLAGAVTMLLTDRAFQTGFFRPAEGGDPVLYQHVFWFYSHPAVYIMVVPAMGLVSQVLPAFSGKKLFGYKGMVIATSLIGIIGFMVWGHHMFVSGVSPLLRMIFMFMTMLIAIPTGIKIFSWLATIWGGQIRFTTSMLFGLGFIGLFTIGGMGGVLLAVVPIDVQTHDTYFVVAHFHYVLFGGSMMGILAGLYFYFPKMSGRFLSEKMGKIVFWGMFLGMNMTFFPMHLLGLLGMPRRIYNYAQRPEFTGLNQIASIGYLLMFIGGMTLILSVILALRKPKTAEADAWNVNDVQQTLDWTTSSPPPVENFPKIPVVA
ncbi:MAG: cytochrome c oxidase subunit I [bacterium]|nr:cytochrome c oxidase subunit I [bacterium]